MRSQLQAAAIDAADQEDKLAQRLRERLAARYRPVGDEPVDDLGIPLRMIHRVISAIFAVIGLNILALSVTSFGAALAHPTLRAAAATAVVLSPFWVIAGRHLKPQRHRELRHLAIALGTFIFCYAAQYTGDLRGALLATMLVCPILAAIAIPGRQAVPYVVIGAAAILTVGLYSHEYGSALRAVVMMLVTLAASAMVIANRAQLVNALRANRELSESDALTGLANVRLLATRLEEECERSSRLDTHFACAQFDLDEFKLVNDSYSHSLGDAVLVATAKAIREQVTEADLVARRGGDEFVIVIPAAEQRDVAPLVRACADAIRASRAELCPDITATASVGWVVHRTGETPAEVLARLDGELHDAKRLAHEKAAREGRGRGVALFDDEAPGVDSGLRGEVLKLRRHEAATRDDDLLDPMAMSMAIAWRIAAMITVAAATAVLALAAFGAPGVANNLPLLFVTVCAVLLAPICWQMSERRTQPRWAVHAMAIAALAVITAGGFFAGGSSAPGSDLYLLPMFVLVFVMTPRAATIYGVFVLAFYTYFVVSAHYPEAFVRVTMTTVVVVLISLVIGFSRALTITAVSKHLELARVDALTGLPNVRQLRARLDAEIRRCNVTGESFVLAMLDLDGFKEVNDRYSHSLGDRVLAGVADALRDTARAAEMPARRGGDEFAVVLTGATDAGAIAAVERIAEAITAKRAHLCPGITPTAGVGWVRWQRGETTDSLLHRADDALHEAKRAPRGDELIAAEA